MDRFFILSGCSGGGKSSLVVELAHRGYVVAQEPGRRIVAEEMQNAGNALPWINMEAFARRAIEVSLADRSSAPDTGIVFFDRSLIDSASTLRSVTGDAFIERLKEEHRYNKVVFLTPPWPEIYVNDAERQHDFSAALEEYERLLRDYQELGYETCVLPKTSIQNRADEVLNKLDLTNAICDAPSALTD